ncbi:unnamed protein product [Cutaneotrichosporon oleaginosum]
MPAPPYSALGLFDWELGPSPSASIGSLATSPFSRRSRTLESPARAPLTPRSATLPTAPHYTDALALPPTPTSLPPSPADSSAFAQTRPPPSPPSPSPLPPSPPSPPDSPSSFPSSLSPPPSPTRFAVPSPPSMSPRSYPSSLSDVPLTPDETSASRPQTQPAYKASDAEQPRTDAFTDARAPMPATRHPPPAYESIQVVAHRPEDIDAVRSALAQLQLTWSLYRELGRPSNLADALERQLSVVVGSVDLLADLPPFTITVPKQRH